MSTAIESARHLNGQTTKRLANSVMRLLKAAPKVPVIILFFMIMMAITANWISPHSPLLADLGKSMLPPAWMGGGDASHLLGTDRFGRDILSRIIYGARVSMIVAILSITLSAALGTTIGLIAGYYKGKVDSILMRITDSFLTFPGIMIALVLAIVLGSSFTNVIIIIMIIIWPRFARQVRGEALGIREQEFVVISRSMGIPAWKVMFRHIFPNVIPSLLILVTFEVAHVVIFEATLSFLGVGIPPPNPSWGSMISDGRAYLETAWWISIFPGVCIALTVFSLNMLGDWARDRLDPKLRQM